VLLRWETVVMERARRVRFGRLVKVVGLMLIAIGAMAAASLAEPTSHDGLGARRTGPPGVPDSDEGEARIAYNNVRETLKRGEPRSAQRLLEQLIARFPDTQTADQARRDLFEFYSAEGAQRTRAAPLGKPSYLGATRPRPPDSERPPAAPAGAPVGSDTLNGWRPVVRHARTLQNHFRGVAGDRVFFDEGSAELGARALSVLAAQAAWLRRYPQSAVVVEGHADDPGPASENTTLSVSRAEAVRAQLLGRGVEPERVAIKVYGRDRPVAVCGEPQCAAQNRRAVSVIKNAGTGAAQPAGLPAIDGASAVSIPMPGLPR
jgi:outer membrane protein OmpA-like peptidoglycan-associated protein